MSIRKISFDIGEYYHVFNRGVEKRSIFMNKNDVSRFIESIKGFNTIEAIGSLYEASFAGKHQLGGLASKLVFFLVEINVRTQMQQLFIRLDVNGFKLTLEQRTVAFVLIVEIHCVASS